ncbi:hypothetical protein VTP01DRAFT_6385 [Rhizomucor pusillus]|uniref:uncharacterized protein n=1 Tax=Rhizomucor pusillus TaxID=4840 RepID=UPI003743D8C4
MSYNEIDCSTDNPAVVYITVLPLLLKTKIMSIYPRLNRIMRTSSSGHQEIAAKRADTISIFNEYKTELHTVEGEAIAVQFTNEHILRAAEVLVTSNDIFVQGFTPISVFSDNSTFEEFSMLRSAFDGSATGHHIINVINQALGIELSPARLSFANLWPAAGQYIEIDLYTKLMVRFYKVIKRLIIPTISFDAATAALSNFTGLSVGPDEYKQIIGDMRITNYDSDFDYSSISIVDCHPAFLRPRAADLLVLVQLFYFVWVRTLVAVECCMQLLNADNNVPTLGSLE